MFIKQLTEVRKEACVMFNVIVSENSLHLHGTFFMFAAVLLILFPISYIILPETKDISLGEITQLGKYLIDQKYFRTHRAAFQKKIFNGKLSVKRMKLFVPETKVPEQKNKNLNEKKSCPSIIHTKYPNSTLD